MHTPQECRLLSVQLTREKNPLNWYPFSNVEADTPESQRSQESPGSSEGAGSEPEGGDKKEGKKKRTYSQVHMPSHDQIMQVMSSLIERCI